MEEWQKRVIKEKQDLDLKRERLDSFFSKKAFADLDDDQKALMVDQSLIMGEYSEILGKRIDAFK